jgi:(E)-4-hydroxy-3-methyl-but-2-enyl pyrophosphate reductase
MRVLVAKSAGFCWGVKRAVDKARKLAAGRASPIYSDGPLIHNEQMMMQLRAENVVETHEPHSIGNSPLIIRAHGIPPSRLAMLQSLPIQIVDATCPDVARIHRLISEYADKGYHIVIFGDTGHAEVEGLLGHAGGKGHVVGRPEDVTHLPDMCPVCLVSQSTQLPVAYMKITEAVRGRFPDAVVLDTICKSTKRRQEELVGIAANVDAIVVVGDTHSANTRRLVELGQSLGKPTFHIQTRNQIDRDSMKIFRVVGLTAGASTPSFVLEDVRKTLEEISDDDAASDH